MRPRDRCSIRSRDLLPAWLMNPSKIIGVSWLLAANQLALAQNADLQGVFVNPTQSEAGIKAAIDSATQEFSFIARPIARSRLKKHSPAIKRVEIAQGQAISIKLGGTKPSQHTPGQPPVKWRRDDGEVFDVTMEWQGAVLVQTFVSPEGQRVNRYFLSADGKALSMEVTLSGPQLSRAVRYTLTYLRE